jgi:Holliday junction resolvasome RuvABC DNA-binding subunit
VSTTRSSRFDDVVKLEEAKQALRGLGYKARAAQRVLEQVRAHVATNADVSALVRAVLDLDRTEKASSASICDESVCTLAARALVQSGFSSAIAEQAVARASAHVGTETDLATFLKEALRHCVV